MDTRRGHRKLPRDRKRIEYQESVTRFLISQRMVCLMIFLRQDSDGGPNGFWGGMMWQLYQATKEPDL